MLSYHTREEVMNNQHNQLNDLKIPAHIAIVMDGNGRWAKSLGKRRLSGHKAGVAALRQCVENCAQLGVRYLTVFAFSSENWKRPISEVNGIMRLFVKAIQSELPKLNQNQIALRFIGDTEKLPSDVLESMKKVNDVQLDEPCLTLIVALNYGGRWDILQAAQTMQDKGIAYTEENFAKCLATSCYAPEPDLFIRTGGELRISNFLLWQVAYAELYFTSRLWPDFGKQDLMDAIIAYTRRERRFGAI